MDPRGLGHGPESPLGPGRPRRPSEPGPSRQRHRVELAGPGTRARVARDGWSTLGHLDTIASRQGMLVDTVVLQTRARVTRDIWWTALDMGHGPESPGTAGRPLRPSDLDPIPLGQLVKTKGPGTKAQVAREGWLTPQALGAGPESPGTSG